VSQNRLERLGAVLRGVRVGVQGEGEPLPFKRGRTVQRARGGGVRRGVQQRRAARLRRDVQGDGHRGLQRRVRRRLRIRVRRQVHIPPRAER
jgi:hypothetical protein